jgi:hypothetical protein
MPDARSRAVVGAALVGTLALARWSLEAPPVAPERARALLATHAALFTETPRPTGSVEAGAARERIAAALRDAGCPPVVQREWACAGSTCARIENLWCRVGPTEGPAVVGMAHTDSVPAGPGAADDGAGVVAWVEALRGIDPAALRRPLVLLLTDGEELGLLGARAWFADPPVEVGVVVNLEARGTTGAAFLFQTVGPPRPWGSWAGGLGTWPRASSLYPAVYERLPNDTDLSIVGLHGVPGVNHAFLGEVARYHTPLDDRAHLDPRSLAHLADLAAGWIRVLGRDGDGDPGAFTDVLGLWLVRWPAGAAAPLAVALALLAGGLVALDLRAGRSTPGSLVRALGAALLATSAAVAFAEALGAGVAAVGVGWWWHPQRLVAAAWAVTVAAWAPTGAVATPHARWAIAVGASAALGLVAVATEPRLAVVALPGLALALAARAAPGSAGLAGAAVGGALGYGPLALGLADAVTARHPVVVALPASLVVLGASAFAPERWRWGALGALGVAGALAGSAAWGPPDPERPAPVTVTHVEAPSGATRTRTAWLTGEVRAEDVASRGLPAPTVERRGRGFWVTPARGGGLRLPGGCAVDGVRGPGSTSVEWWGVPPGGVAVVCPGGAAPDGLAEVTHGLPDGGDGGRGPGEGPVHRGDRTLVIASPEIDGGG